MERSHALTEQKKNMRLDFIRNLAAQCRDAASDSGCIGEVDGGCVSAVSDTGKWCEKCLLGEAAVQLDWALTLLREPPSTPLPAFVAEGDVIIGDDTDTFTVADLRNWWTRLRATLKRDEPVKPETGPMRNAESPSGVQALGSSSSSPSLGETPAPLEETKEEKDHALLHPVSQVYFRAGLLACREYMARFVAAESPSIANSIRANWWPDLGPDFGPPRQLDWSEVTSGEYGTPEFRVKTADEVSPTQEALPVALAFLQVGRVSLPDQAEQTDDLERG